MSDRYVALFFYKCTEPKNENEVTQGN